MSSLSPGTTLSSYEIRSVPGGGGMGEVYRATARRQRDSGLVGLKLNRLLRPLHDNPRWTALLGELRLAD